MLSFEAFEFLYNGTSMAALRTWCLTMKHLYFRIHLTIFLWVKLQNLNWNKLRQQILELCRKMFFGCFITVECMILRFKIKKQTNKKNLQCLTYLPAVPNFLTESILWSIRICQKGMTVIQLSKFSCEYYCKWAAFIHSSKLLSVVQGNSPLSSLVPLRWGKVGWRQVPKVEAEWDQRSWNRGQLQDRYSEANEIMVSVTMTWSMQSRQC